MFGPQQLPFRMPDGDRCPTTLRRVTCLSFGIQILPVWMGDVLSFETIDAGHEVPSLRFGDLDGRRGELCAPVPVRGFAVGRNAYGHAGLMDCVRDPL